MHTRREGSVTGHDFSRAGKFSQLTRALAPEGSSARDSLPSSSFSAASAPTAQTLKAFFRSFESAPPPILLLDYDGTLAPFRKDRFKARPYTGIREILAKIQQGRTRIVFITGRPATEIAPLVGLDNVEVWGLHGAEHLYPDGRREMEQLPEATQEKLAQLRRQLQQDSFGALFEDKPNAAVLHWRGATEEKAAQIRENTLSLFTPLAGTDGLILLEFASGLELRAGRDKGGAVTAILKDSPPASPAAFLGDDFTDESGFQAINRRPYPSLSILVRKQPRLTQAQLWLEPPAELRSFLKAWLKHSA